MNWESEVIGQAQARAFDGESVWEDWCFSIGNDGRGYFMWFKESPTAELTTRIDITHANDLEEAKAAALAIWRTR